MATAGKNAIGIVLPGCDDKVTAGDDLDVQIKDIGAWTAGAAVAYGDELAVGAGGKAVKGNSKVLYRWHCAGRSNKKQASALLYRS